jgi:hypothetical protein
MGVPLPEWLGLRFGEKLEMTPWRKRRNPGFKMSRSKGRIFMRTNLRRGIGVLAVVVGMGICGEMVQAVAAPFFHDQEGKAAGASDPDYSKNKTYQQGVREGQADKAQSKDHSKGRHFKKDDDQKAYEAGYQKGRN